MTLPCPRFEFRWTATSDDMFHWDCVYALVIPLNEHDIRREDQDGNKVRSEQTIEIGRTKVTRGTGSIPVFQSGEVDTPFRDGAHAQWDRKALGLEHLPIFAVCGEHFTNVDEANARRREEELFREPR